MFIDFFHLTSLAKAYYPVFDPYTYQSGFSLVSWK
jgi:hypothetical protein